MVAQFVDISVFQPTTIDWNTYKQWSASGDGISRVAMRTSYGVGYIDQHFSAFNTGALNAGIDSIIYYHYAYPQYNNPVDEANWQFQIIPNIRPQDIIMLDFEESIPEATSGWALQWLSRQKTNYGKSPAIYSYPSFIVDKLQDSALAEYPLWYANWQFTPDERPTAPSPWKSYEWLQYSDRASIPGIPGLVDADIYLGGSMIPNDWNDDGVTLVAPNGKQVILGFRSYVLSHNWDPANIPLENEEGTSHVEDYTPSDGGTRQLFLYSELAWTQATQVYQVPVGRELAGARAQIANDTVLQDVKAFTSALAKLQAD